MTAAYRADRLFDGQSIRDDVAFAVTDGLIAASAPSAEPVRLRGLVAPGFVDLQVNGGGGKLFNADPTLACIKTIAAAHARFGTTGWLPTLITDSLENMERAADAVCIAREAATLGVLGIHFEGPHLAAEKRGVHPVDHVRPPAEAELKLMMRRDLGERVVTVAPEAVAPEVIARLVAAGVHVCLGHSNADYEIVQRALAAGASGFTHLYNAMSPLTARAPGMVGAALLDERSWCGVIADGVHAHDAALQLALRAKPQGKVFLVTDAMPPVGTSAQEFEFFGGRVRREGDVLRAADGALAGSTLDMASAVRNAMQRLGVDLEEALRMGSAYPAVFLGRSRELGHLRPGANADFVLLDDELRVTGTWIGGRQVSGAEVSKAPARAPRVKA